MEAQKLTDNPITSFGKPYSDDVMMQMKLTPEPFVMFGIESKEDFFTKVGKAAADLLLFRYEMASKDEELKRQRTEHHTQEYAYEAAKFQNEYIQQRNTLLFSEFILKNIFPKRDETQSLTFRIESPPDHRVSSYYECTSMLVTIDEKGITVVDRKFAGAK